MGKMVSATEFKATCLALIDEMMRSGEPLTITRRGRPSLTLTAQRSERAPFDKVFGSMNGTVTIQGDLDEPVDPAGDDKWLAKWDERLAEER